MTVKNDSQDMVRNERLHRVVVAGIVRIIRHLAQLPPKTSISLSGLLKVGCAHLTEEDYSSDELDASTFILEYVKDGVVNITPDLMEQIKAGDFTAIWSLANTYLVRFGHPEVEPSSIDDLLR